LATIALDAMGGDYAPVETVAGAVDASGRGVEVVLVGDREILAVEVAKHNVDIPIAEAVSSPKRVDLEGDGVLTARGLGICLGD